MNHVEILPVLILLTKYVVSTSLLRVYYLPTDNCWAFDYYEKHSPKVVQTRSKKICADSLPLGYRNAAQNNHSIFIMWYSRTVTLQPVNPFGTT